MGAGLNPARDNLRAARATYLVEKPIRNKVLTMRTQNAAERRYGGTEAYVPTENRMRCVCISEHFAIPGTVNKQSLLFHGRRCELL